MKCSIPGDYRPVLDLKQTERAIKLIKDFFQHNLAAELKLRRVTAPLFVQKGTGVNDELNGIERPVSFRIKDMNDTEAEIVHSLAKWKRMMLADYKISNKYGLYTDMNAIRPDEELDNIHSIYVDQWDWEKILMTEDRTLNYLKATVRRIYEVLKRTEFVVFESHPEIKPILPEDIFFIHAEELYEMYPNNTPAEREQKIVEKHKAVFLIGIGYNLAGGEPHDGRAPDYDDWSTETENGFKGLNGDILVWNPVLKSSFEISSMGIRVDKTALLRQLEIRGKAQDKELMFHSRLILCMFFLRKAHIGEVQASIWPEEMHKECGASGIMLM